ncbi:hypothetical protein [Sporosarcina limicola]|uniref:Lipoprotein n=1 Tax=Sporosarcina limicola TaxID=34101 RepID=A0A927MKA7_9BACL|nr:hypothetical protein [Sporosarcina limicola]MBE1555940.1 hypothetical protein [Sporosarcina limicola]
MNSKWVYMISALFLLVGCGTDANVNEGKKADSADNGNSSESAEGVAKKAGSKSSFFSTFSEGTYQADIMTIGLPADMSDKMNQISETIEESLAENQEWYLEALEGLEDGEVLPYDEKLGVTKEEYTLILQANNYFELGKIGNCEIEIQKEDKTLIINNPDSTILKKLTISGDGNTITTDSGELMYKEEILASDAQAVTGRWNGYFYRLGGENTKVLQISIGELEDSSKKIMFIEIFEEGKEKEEEILIF